MPDPIRCAICGATGTTGSVVAREVLRDPRLQLCGAIAAQDDPAVGTSLAPGVVVTADMATALSTADVVIDFSAPAATAILVAQLHEHPLPAVVGTTGLGADVEASLDRLATHRPIVVAPNMGLGINVLRRLVREAAAVLAGEWDPEIVEIHHRRKQDAPSGTALALAADLAAAAGLDGPPTLCREGLTGPRRSGEIGVQALRGGDVVGEHTVYLLGDGERIELTHRATDRTTFALGAVRAAAWLVSPDRTPGRFTMNDVLFGHRNAGS